MTETAAQPKSPVKVPNRGYNSRFRPFLSDKDTPPIRDVYRDGKVIAGITESQMIAEGWRAPLAVKRDFSKTEEERAEWKKVHSNAKGPTGSTNVSRSKEIKSTLIIHRANLHHKKDFATTISIPAYPSEVLLIVGNHHDPRKHKLVSKYYYRGKAFQVE